MFLCHDRVKEFGFIGGERGGRSPVMDMCFALDSPLLAIWLTFFLRWERGGTCGQEHYHLSIFPGVYLKDAGLLTMFG